MRSDHASAETTILRLKALPKLREKHQFAQFATKVVGTELSHFP